MSEGIFFERKNQWAEVNRWPKGADKARLQVNDGPPFGHYTLQKARDQVAIFIEAESRKDHGYTSFAILPLPDGRRVVSEETKQRLCEQLRKAREKKAQKTPAKEESEEPTRQIMVVGGSLMTAAIRATAKILKEDRVLLPKDALDICVDEVLEKGATELGWRPSTQMSVGDRVVNPQGEVKTVLATNAPLTGARAFLEAQKRKQTCG